MKRCAYVDLNDPLYIHYHDEEWGVPEHDDHKLFELLLLECFQAGLSWRCILHKREAFRQALDGFDVEKVAEYDDAKIEALMADSSIVRNRLKLRAAVTNAQAFKAIQAEYDSFDSYIWGFTDRQVIVEPYDLRTTSSLSDQISKDLKKWGMKFVGSTIIYSYLQAIGIINGHGQECDLHI